MLTANEKAEIVKLLSLNKNTLEISKKLKRDHRTVKRFVNEGKTERKSHSNGRPKVTTARDIRKIKRSLSANPHSTSKSIFESAGVTGISKRSRNRILKDIADQRSPTKCPPLSDVNRQKRLTWAKKYLKTDFQSVLWTDEARATLDGPDGWCKGWLLKGARPRLRYRRQQGGGGVMIWAGIIGSNIVGPFLVPEGVKMNSVNYCSFLEENLLPWLNSQDGATQRNLIVQQDNAPSHASRYTKGWLSDKGISGERLMDWPPQSPDLNPIENLWSIIKRKVYQNGVQFSSKQDLWDRIKEVSSQISKEDVHKLTSSVDRRLMDLIRNGGKRVKG